MVGSSANGRQGEIATYCCWMRRCSSPQDLIQAILSSFDSIVATRAAVASDPAESVEPDDDDEEATSGAT